MDSTTSTEELHVDLKSTQESVLLDIIKDICSDLNSKISPKLKAKVNQIIADCDLSNHTSLHKLTTTGESTTTLLGLMHTTAAELTFDEQTELNQAIIYKIQTKIPIFSSELDRLRQTITKGKKSRKDEIKELQQSLDDKLNTLEAQEQEKVELMMEWINHRVQEVVKFNDDSSEMLTLKTKILELKSKILYLQILQNIFTETNKSIKAYNEIHKDLKESLQETENRIKDFQKIIASDT